MGKKPYVTPRAVDLSLEGLTGIGATTCDTGTVYSAGSCANGEGAETHCTHGFGVNGSCVPGTLPTFGTGSYCGGGTNATAVCYFGTTTSAAHTGCATGDVAAYQNFCGSGSNVGDCSSGSAQAAICESGDSQTSHIS
ncbi:MAG: hypothetical protein HQK56_05660 [Deltaproteobacteria bacterium]|nr:hypothetical protein [Deltaproteobacteria bacterium]